MARTPQSQTAQQAFATARLSLVDDILVTAGWTEDDVGWSPPEHYREAIETLRGRGQWSRANAIKFMVTADEHAAVTR